MRESERAENIFQLASMLSMNI